MTPKQIIIDKDAFVGIALNRLKGFAANHVLLVCDTLLYECLTSADTESRRPLDDCRNLIEGGAYYCSCGVDFLKWEAHNLRPYPPFLPDLHKTERIGAGNVRDQRSFGADKVGEIVGAHNRHAENVFLETVRRLGPRIGSERPDIARDIKTLPKEPYARMTQWLDGLDGVGMHGVAVRSMPKGWVRDDARFCQSQEWVSWQYFRLASVIANEYYYLRQMGGIPGMRRAEHDYQDMEYVLLLSRAAGILTRDKKLVKPLAQAAFADKDVFSGLDEVPEEYLCHWR